MDRVPKLANTSLYVAIKVNCKVDVEHQLEQCVLVLSIHQLLLILLIIRDLYDFPIYMFIDY